MNKALDFTNLDKIINKHSLFLFRYWQWKTKKVTKKLIKDLQNCNREYQSPMMFSSLQVHIF